MILLVMNSDIILSKIQPLIYTAIVVVAFISLGKAMLKNDYSKLHIQLGLCAFVAFAAKTPNTLADIGAFMYAIISSFGGGLFG
jgi:hypothetical protein